MFWFLVSDCQRFSSAASSSSPWEWGAEKIRKTTKKRNLRAERKIWKRKKKKHFFLSHLKERSIDRRRYIFTNHYPQWLKSVQGADSRKGKNEELNAKKKFPSQTQFFLFRIAYLWAFYSRWSASMRGCVGPSVRLFKYDSLLPTGRIYVLMFRLTYAKLMESHEKKQLLSKKETF